MLFHESFPGRSSESELYPLRTVLFDTSDMTIKYDYKSPFAGYYSPWYSDSIQRTWVTLHKTTPCYSTFSEYAWIDFSLNSNKWLKLNHGTYGILNCHVRTLIAVWGEFKRKDLLGIATHGGNRIIAG